MAGDELVDVIEHRVGVVEPRVMVAPFELDVFRLRQLLCQVAPVADLDDLVLLPMHDQRRATDGRKHAPNVDVHRNRL